MNFVHFVIYDLDLFLMNVMLFCCTCLLFFIHSVCLWKI